MREKELLTKLESGTLGIEADRHRYRDAEIARHEEIEATEMILIAVNKQIAKKPLMLESIKYSYISSMCPSCKRFDVGLWNFCPDCGQKLDWSE